MYYLKKSCTFSFIVVLISLLVTDGAAQLQPRITGGTDAKVGEFPYITLLRYHGQPFCGGSIISKNHILTAAHCVEKCINSPETLSVQYGIVDINDSLGPNIISVKSVKVHEKYDSNYFVGMHDIAILKLTEDIEFGQNVSAVPLPGPFEDIGDNAIAEVAGWGSSFNDGSMSAHLKKFFITIFRNDYCYILDNRYDFDAHICGDVQFGWHGICGGDSGGPLVVDGKQFGIVSGAEGPCGSPEFPDVFTRVTTYRKWIKTWSGV